MTDRWTRNAWIAHGFDVLQNGGHEKRKADKMAKTPGVSRGSINWHFPSLGDFHDAMLVAWREQNTQSIIAELKALPDAQAQFAVLIQKTIQTPQTLENSMRRWGGVNPEVAAALVEVDQLRMAYLINLMLALSVPDDVARDPRDFFDMGFHWSGVCVWSCSPNIPNHFS
jgi:AcrR family transcriptional regulator